MSEMSERTPDRSMSDIDIGSVNGESAPVFEARVLMAALQRPRQLVFPGLFLLTLGSWRKIGCSESHEPPDS